MEAKKVAIIGTAVSVLFATGVASAEEGSAATSAPVAVRTTTTTAADPPGDTDHDRFVGHIGVAYMGLTDVPIAGGPGTTVPAPVIGVRYWLMRNLGIDAGLGIGWFNADNNVARPFAMALHGGVPIALAYGQHYTFVVVPEANFGFSSQTTTAPGVPDTTASGILFNLGGRVGAEVNFGFIGIPQLALQGSVGLLFQVAQRKTSVGPMSQSGTETSLQTTLGPTPWGIFNNSITAIYYL